MAISDSILGWTSAIGLWNTYTGSGNPTKPYQSILWLGATPVSQQTGTWTGATGDYPTDGTYSMVGHVNRNSPTQATERYQRPGSMIIRNSDNGGINIISANTTSGTIALSTNGDADTNVRVNIDEFGNVSILKAAITALPNYYVTMDANGVLTKTANPLSLSASIQPLFTRVIDSTELADTAFVPIIIGYSDGIVIDTLIYGIESRGSSPTTRPDIRFGTNNSAAGTAVVSGIVSAVTTEGTITKRYTFNNPSVDVGNQLWMKFQGTVSFKKFVVVVMGHKLPTLISPFCAEADALFARMTVQPTVAKKYAINRFILSLKSDGIWQKFDCFQVYAAETEQQGLLNWVKDAHNATNTSMAFHADSGFMGNGTSAYINTQYNLYSDSVHFKNIDQSIGIYTWRDIGSGVVMYLGATNNVQSTYFWNYSSALKPSLLGGGVSMSSLTGNTAAFFYAERTKSTHITGQRNYVRQEVANSVIGNFSTSTKLYVSARNNNGTADLFSRNTTGCFFIGGALTSAQASLFYDRWLRYKFDIGK